MAALQRDKILAPSNLLDADDISAFLEPNVHIVIVHTGKCCDSEEIVWRVKHIVFQEPHPYYPDEGEPAFTCSEWQGT